MALCRACNKYKPNSEISNGVCKDCIAKAKERGSMDEFLSKEDRQKLGLEA